MAGAGSRTGREKYARAGASLGIRLCMALACALAVAAVAAQEPAEDGTQTASPSGQNAQRVTVTGTVRNAATGDPLPRALVQIEGDADTGTLTDGEGRFEIPGVPAGPQIIRVAKPGYRDRPYATEEAGLQAEGPAHDVLVAAQMPELVFSLNPDCAIRGHIDLSTGDPAEGISVILLQQVVRSGRALWTIVANKRANGDGNYRFGGLPAGTYMVFTLPALESEPAVDAIAAGSAKNIARSGFAPVFYPDARDLSGAAPIRLSAGSQVDANLSLALEPFYPVTIHATAPGGNGGADKLSQPGGYTGVIMDASGHPTPYIVQYDDTTQSLQANLPDGSYSVVLRSFLRPRFTAGAGDGGRGSIRNATLAGAADFTVAGHAINGLRVGLGTPAAASVHLRLVHNPDFSSTGAFAVSNASELVNLNLDPAGVLPENSFESIWSMENGADSITFTAQPGSYWLSTYLPRKGVCVGGFTAGATNLAREPLAVSLLTAPPPMELTLRDDCGTLALTLPAALAEFLPGDEPFYTVYLVPDFDTVMDTPPMTMHPSSGATLTVDGLTPGSYHVYLFASPVHLEYRNPAALAALANPGQQVTIAAGTTATLTLEAPQH